MTEYLVIFERADDGGWGAYLPDLPGVVALGANHDEVAAGIREAVHAYAEEMRALGRVLPTPRATASTVQAA
jgi:predicted RNase H-like HicB family nuclease